MIDTERAGDIAATLAADGYHLAIAEAGDRVRVTITAGPYFAWANRGAGPMRVWIPRD